MHYVILAFEEEEGQAKFMRRFDQYKALRDQIGARAAASVELDEDEEAEMWA